MGQDPMFNLATGVFGGGGFVAVLTHVLGREKIRAEARKILAEGDEATARADEAAARAAETRARTTKSLGEMSVLQQGETTGTARMPHGWRDWGQDASAYEMGFDEK